MVLPRWPGIWRRVDVVGVVRDEEAVALVLEDVVCDLKEAQASTTNAPDGTRPVGGAGAAVPCPSTEPDGSRQIGCVRGVAHASAGGEDVSNWMKKETNCVKVDAMPVDHLGQSTLTVTDLGILRRGACATALGQCRSATERNGSRSTGCVGRLPHGAACSEPAPNLGAISGGD